MLRVNELRLYKSEGKAWLESNTVKHIERGREKTLIKTNRGVQTP